MNQSTGKLNFEKRREPRKQADVEVRFTVATIQEMVDQMVGPRKPGVSSWKSGASRNLSRGGLFVVTPSRLEPRQVLSLDLRLTGRAEPVHAFAEVIWCRPDMESEGQWQAGIEFIAVKAPDADALEAYLK